MGQDKACPIAAAIKHIVLSTCWVENRWEPKIDLLGNAKQECIDAVTTSFGTKTGDVLSRLSIGYTVDWPGIILIADDSIATVK